MGARREIDTREACREKSTVKRLRYTQEGQMTFTPSLLQMSMEMGDSTLGPLFTPWDSV